MDITASDIKKNSSILQNALKEDLIVTKRDKPFVVVVDYEKYQRLSENAKRYENSHKNIENPWLKSALQSEKNLSKDDLNFKKSLNENYKENLEDSKL